MPILTPEDFGALGNGLDDGVALQNWLNALRDEGLAEAPAHGGYFTSLPLLLQPSTNIGPVTGPKFLGNLKITGLPTLPNGAHVLRVWNPDAVTTSQNFYHASFDSLDLSGTTGTGCGLSLRGFWGKIGQIQGSNVQDVVQFPNFLFNGIPDEYESMCDLGDVTGLNMRGYVMNNQIGIGASPSAHNVRGSVASLAGGMGCILASGSENISGCIAYSGLGPAVSMVRAGSGGGGHEIFMQGNGDEDATQYGFRLEYGEVVKIIGHRLNVEPPGFSGAGSPSWPLVGYSFGKAGVAGGPPIGRLVDVEVHGLVSIRPGVTPANMGTLADFNSDYNVANLTLNLTIEDQVGFWSGLPLATRYKNISPYATMKIIENGVTVYSH